MSATNLHPNVNDTSAGVPPAPPEAHQRAGGETRAFALYGQDVNTILAALRFWQENGMGEPENRSDEMHAIATNDDADISLDDDGIDDLCQRLNA